MAASHGKYERAGYPARSAAGWKRIRVKTAAFATAASISKPLDFKPTLRVLETALEELEEAGSGSGGASHAAMVGSLGEEQLFYVQSRGFARGSAERMIALAFFEPVIARFPSDVLRDEVRTALDQRLEEIPETFASQ